MPINSKHKGDRFERQIAGELQRWWPEAVRQTFDQARDGTACPDIKGTPYWIECKNWRRVTPGKAKRFYYKACQDAGIDNIDNVILIYKEDKRRQLSKKNDSQVMVVLSNALLHHLELKANYCRTGEANYFTGMDQMALISWDYLSDLFDYVFHPAPISLSEDNSLTAKRGTVNAPQRS